ncbi:virulence RhuM family protein [Dysgonomonas sp. ZJ279]|uniref:virulence RhuM family protein n=1 Tax=Dysgonomonas sp. ZJ279 TaxID=2709796 RepID=UPI0013ED2F76|nr:virulence RhuM family protein [Dysgonomonas sp. ZJ279]
MENRKIIISDNGTVTVPGETKMSIAEIADLFGIYYQRAKRLIRDIEKSGVMGGDYSGGCTCEGSKIYPDYYGLEMIIAVAFRVQSAKAEIFRKRLLRREKAGDSGICVFVWQDWNRISLN